MRNIKKLLLIFLVISSMSMFVSCKSNNKEATEEAINFTENSWVVERMEIKDNISGYEKIVAKVLVSTFLEQTFILGEDNMVSVKDMSLPYEIYDDKIEIFNTNNSYVFEINFLEDDRVLLENDLIDVTLTLLK